MGVFGGIELFKRFRLIHTNIKWLCAFIFLNLEGVIAQVVKKIGNETGLTTLVDLQGLLPSDSIKAVIASTTSGKRLPEENLKKTIDVCDCINSLDLAKNKVLEYVAPNLTVLVGSVVSSKLIGTAGALSALAKMLACKVQFFGAHSQRVGFLQETDIF
ncbi:hypothetical protein IFM89_030636 [Coptis chinensis]|uniref:Nop domain-containing protein n=1 Tax=Coptis chinensis TaxID=261450 RepID=A0A835HR68_9MAGN|nr:hypothetical protein IFM89_030636 [Coptis chinensis]